MDVPAFYLYLPPTPVRGRFVMLEESSKTFYDVDSVTPRLGNPPEWAETGLSPTILGALGRDLAIVIPHPHNAKSRAELARQPEADQMPTRALEAGEVGRLVAIKGREDDVIDTETLGIVIISPYTPDLMSFGLMQNMKGSVIADEMQNGLLGKLYGGLDLERPFVHPEVLEQMPRRWHKNAELLNTELDGLFASGLIVEEGTVGWQLSDAEDYRPA